MTPPTETYRVYAIKYAEHKDRKSSANFIGGDPHESPMPMDYFVWAIIGKDRTFLVDSGFDQEAASRRGGRKVLTPINEGLAALGVKTEDVKDVIISHMHYDHAGNRDMFPNAHYHVQDKEIQFCTGRCMCHKPLAVHFEPADVASMVLKTFAGRTVFHDGDDEIAPGITVHHVGGHTAGMQIVRVWTAKGWMVLMSDASHYYANMEQKRPFPAVYNVAELMDGYKRAHSLAASPQLAIPGHDPLVLQRFPAEKREHEGWIARLDGDMR